MTGKLDARLPQGFGHLEGIADEAAGTAAGVRPCAGADETTRRRAARARTRLQCLPIRCAAVVLCLVGLTACKSSTSSDASMLRAGVAPGGVAFPPAREAMAAQLRKSPEAAGLRPGIIEALQRAMPEGHWALWRHGYLLHVEGDFQRSIEIKSAAKAIHAVLVGATLEQGRIFSVDDDVADFVPALRGSGVTWRHLLTQTAGLHEPDLPPGRRFVYHETNPEMLCEALARVWGRAGYRYGYDKVIANALLDPIGARGWETDAQDDGVRLVMDLEDLGRFGLLMTTGGVWRGRQVVPADFLRELSTKQTRGMEPDYHVLPKPDMPHVESGLRPEDFPEAPYGYMTWVNTDRDLWPDASASWAAAHGSGNHIVAWDPGSGMVLAVLGGRFAEVEGAPPGWPVPMRPALETIDAYLAGPHPGVAPRKQRLGEIAAQRVWAPFEITLRGPKSTSRAGPNPFGLRLDIEFEAPRGERLRVPGFYAGNGRGGPDGDVWKVRFAADEPGLWRVITHSSAAALDGLEGSFEVEPAAPDAPDFFRWGRLEAVAQPGDGIRYLKFRDGPYWLKTGADGPENFLGSFEHYDTQEKRTKAVDYLASRGINALYVMTHNVGGDHRDVWPWLGNSEEKAKASATRDVRFDIPRLERWRTVFEHMQRRGLAIHLVLEDDSGWIGFDRPRYYREMIARFGDLPALLFNLAEEHDERYSLTEALEHMALLARLDPYDHPRGIHNVNEPEPEYLQSPHVDFASIQTKFLDPLDHSPLALEWIESASELGTRVPMIGFDEPRPELVRSGWWAVLLGGGVYEVLVKPPFDQPMEAADRTWIELGGARAFLETLPFWKMAPRPDLVVEGKALLLAAPGEAYALYLPEGGSVAVTLAEGPDYEAAWWKPSQGRDGALRQAGSVAGGTRTFTAPEAGDWALSLRAVPNRR
jgi:CubicO group peptidase (beta-lactamase class C family)